MTVMAVIRIPAKPGLRAQLLDGAQASIAKTQSNPLCLDMQVLLDASDADVLVFIEHWRSAAAHQEFRDSLMQAGAMDAIGPLLGGEITTTYYRQLDGE